MGSCTIQNVIEADGSVYTCDFYVFDDYKLGNVFNDSLDELEKHPVAQNSVHNSRYYSEDCKSCKYFQLCKVDVEGIKSPLRISKSVKQDSLIHLPLFLSKDVIE